MKCEVVTYGNVEWFLYDLGEIAYDVYLLDMEMPGKKGVDVAREIRRAYPDPIIIFVTNYMEYKENAHDINTYRYIRKAALEEELCQGYETLLPMILGKEEHFYVIEKRGEIEKIPYEEMYYMRKEGKYVVIAHKRGESRVRKSLEMVQEELHSPEFLLVEKGYVVNIRHVMKMKSNELYMRDNTVIHVGKARMANVKLAILDYWRQL